MSFLEDLGSAALGAINESLGITENTPDSLDAIEDGRVTNFGKLGDFASKIDQTAHRQYVENGYIRGILPRQLEILTQEPDMTIIIKKRMFSSLIENYKPELMDDKEKLFYRASKKLFERKCKAITAYERLTKIERIATTTEGVFNGYMLPAIFTGIEALNSLGLGGIIDSKTQATLDTMRKVMALSDPVYTTTWIVDRELPALSDLGDGTGTFELTMCSNMSCTSSTVFNQGNANLTIEDPYKMMIITNEEIDAAIMETAGGFLQGSFFRTTQATLQQAVDDLRAQLTELRLTRGVPDIRFYISEGSLLFHKIRAVIDEEGREIKFTFDGGFAGIGASADLDASAFEGVNGLSQDNGESDLFSQILSNLYLLMGLEQTTKPQEFEFNKDTNYVRRKMRLHFANKAIIQPMDVVNIFISTKSAVDPNTANLVTTGFSPNDLMGSINETIGGINSLAAQFSGTGGPSSYDVIEKDAIAGQEFPMWLWNSMKNDFTRQAAGTHVFAGIVNEASHDYTSSNGKYILNVTASDNAGYFTFGQLNTNPSVEVFNAALYDPLTPRELDFDAATGFLVGEEPPLLPENQALLTAGLVKFKNGRFLGTPVSDQAYQGFNIERVEDSFSGSIRRKYEDPDGFVYRWKEGIQSLTLMGEPHNNGTTSESSPNLSKKPFAGQDVMNVLSLLIAGQPYNFNTFIRAAIASGGFNRDDLLNENSSRSFFRGLLGEINKQNATWGNFVPFKKLVINEAGYNFLRSGEFDIVTANSQLSQKLRERARLFDQLVKVMPQYANNPQFLNVDINGNLTNSSTPTDTLDPRLVDPKTLGALGANIIQLDFEIEQLKKTFTDRATSPNLNTSAGVIKIFGDDVSFDPTVSNSSSAITPTDQQNEREELRKKLLYLTQRRLWKVKANEDTNYFIVDDSYDKNYDIQAYEKALAGSLELFNSTYVSIASQITMTADVLGLEVYADSQGNIQARPPQYNRMPSSVFYKMMADRDTKGIQIFPSYLESLFVNQIKGMSDRIEIIEDEIRVRAAALGYISDSSAKGLLNGTVTTGGGTNFSFVTNETDGKFGGKDIRVLLDQVNPDLTEAQNTQALTAIDASIQTVLKNGANFDIIQRSSVVNNKKLGAGGTEAEINDKITAIGKRLNEKTGLPAPTRLSLVSTDKIIPGQFNQLDVLNVTEQIARFVSERQSIMKQLANAVKNLQEGVAINTTDDSGHVQLLPPLNQQKEIPEILEHMIEDEKIDDLGLDSGKRYIIKEHQIINFKRKEKPPAHTIVQVDGVFGEGLVDPPNFDSTGGGNPISTAWAVDFDMWRMYGFRAPQAVSAPFLSNPDTQCAPYAVFLLNKARKEIFQADLTITGNEFIQPGEVYYVEDADFLYYAESVTHNFNYGSGYTTSMVLKYGHNPGEYIPTILDIIGKGLYSNKHQADLSRHNRFGNANGDVAVSTVVFDRNNSDSDPLKSLVGGSYGDQNRKSLTNMLLAASGALAPTTLGKQAYLELRIYFNSKKGTQADGTLQSLADSIKSWIANPAKASTGTSGDLLPDKSASEDVNSFNPNFNIKDMISVVAVDLGETDTRSPSPGAINKMKEVASTSGMPSPLATSVDITSSLDQAANILYTQIVDCWITFRTSTSTTEASKSGSTSTSQSAQLNLQKAIDAFKKKIESQTSGE